MQKKLVRLIKNLPPRTHTKPLMQELEILSIPNLYTLRVCTEMHEYIHQLEDKNRPEHDHNYVSKTTVHHHKTRHATRHHYHVTHDMEHYTRLFTDVWNKLPLQIREKTQKEPFKQALKSYLLATQKYDDDDDDNDNERNNKVPA